MDLKFSLQPGCTSLPPIEVTLYRAVKSKLRAGTSPSSSKVSDSSSPKTKSSSISNEYLKTINAVPVCGPLELSANLDLSGQSGNVVMTSPTLVLNKGRNFYLHIRAKSLSKSSENQELNNQAQTQQASNKDLKSDYIKATTSASSYKLLVAKVKVVFDYTLFTLHYESNTVHVTRENLCFCELFCFLC